MKILLINFLDPYSQKGQKHYPLGLGYLAIALNQKGVEGNIIDLAVDSQNLEEEVSDFNPSATGISVFSTILLEVKKSYIN